MAGKKFKLFLAREGLVSDIPAGGGKIVIPFYSVKTNSNYVYTGTAMG
jgi:hypothetical protein